MAEACPTCGGTQFFECTLLADNCTRRICAGCATQFFECILLADNCTRRICAGCATQFFECILLADNCTRRICAGCATPADESLALLRQIAQDLAAIRKAQQLASPGPMLFTAAEQRPL